jgi:hypothetical protein
VAIDFDFTLEIPTRPILIFQQEDASFSMTERIPASLPDQGQASEKSTVRSRVKELFCLGKGN